MKNNLNGSKLIKVQVHPDSNKEEFFWVADQKIIIKIKEKAENNEANRKVFKILSLIFPRKRIQLKKGSKSKNKIFKIYEEK